MGAHDALNIWTAALTLPKGHPLPPAPHLRINGRRSTRARFPNADPETDQWPIG